MQSFELIVRERDSNHRVQIRGFVHPPLPRGEAIFKLDAGRRRDEVCLSHAATFIRSDDHLCLSNFSGLPVLAHCAAHKGFLKLAGQPETDGQIAKAVDPLLCRANEVEHLDYGLAPRSVLVDF